MSFEWYYKKQPEFLKIDHNTKSILNFLECSLMLGKFWMLLSNPLF